MRKRASGFTLIEMMTTVTLIGLLSVMAYPVVTSFTGGATLEATTRLVNSFHRAIDHGTRRNRAVVMLLDELNPAAPEGLLKLYELPESHCRNAKNYATAGRVFSEVPFGKTPMPEKFSGMRIDQEGLTGWSVDGAAASADDLILCVTPSGAFNRLQGTQVAPVAGRLQVKIQHFANDKPHGPARAVEVTYGGGARLVME